MQSSFFYPVICNIIHHLKYIHSHNKICMRIENEQNIFLSLKLNMKVAVNRYLRGEMVLYFIGAFIGSWITIKAIKFISHLSFTSNCFNLLFFFGEWRCCKRECITALKKNSYKYIFLYYFKGVRTDVFFSYIHIAGEMSWWPFCVCVNS